MDAKRFFQADMAHGEVFPLVGGNAAVFSAGCRDNHTPNEDAAAVIHVNGDAAILVVADGLGGSPGGERASCLAIRQVIASIQQAPHDDSSLRAAILNGIENANHAVTELGIGAATTLAIAEIRAPSMRSDNGRMPLRWKVRPYHVGDSMILMVGQRGKIKLQTISHSPVGYALESGLLDETEAMHHAQRHVVSNVIGAPNMRIEVGSMIEMARYDTLLLASDGLFDNLHTDEIVQRIRKGPLKRVMRTLIEDCRRRMQSAEEGRPCKPDDLTFMAFRLSGTP
jgi:serine/threonine protein phosphatase PrpC